MPRRIQRRSRGGGVSFGGCWENAAGVAIWRRMKCSLLTADLAIVPRFWYTIAK